MNALLLLRLIHRTILHQRFLRLRRETGVLLRLYFNTFHLKAYIWLRPHLTTFGNEFIRGFCFPIVRSFSFAGRLGRQSNKVSRAPLRPSDYVLQILLPYSD